LDRNYDSGFGNQVLFGTIFCDNGVWMDRGEYDGSEWWITNKYPDLIDYFDKSDIVKYERLKKINNINSKLD